MHHPPPRRRAANGPQALTITGFRLDVASQRALAERAAALNISSHELARRYVLEALKVASSPPAPSAPDPAVVLEGLKAVFYHVVETRKDIVLGVEALLRRAGKVSEGEAHAWVRENYPDACSPSPAP